MRKIYLRKKSQRIFRWNKFFTAVYLTQRIDWCLVACDLSGRGISFSKQKIQFNLKNNIQRFIKKLSTITSLTNFAFRSIHFVHWAHLGSFVNLIINFIWSYGLLVFGCLTSHLCLEPHSPLAIRKVSVFIFVHRHWQSQLGDIRHHWCDVSLRLHQSKENSLIFQCNP